MISVSVVFCDSVAAHGCIWVRVASIIRVSAIFDGLRSHRELLRIGYGFWRVFLTLF